MQCGHFPVVSGIGIWQYSHRISSLLPSSEHRASQESLLLRACALTLPFSHRYYSYMKVILSGLILWIVLGSFYLGCAGASAEDPSKQTPPGEEVLEQLEGLLERASVQQPFDKNGSPHLGDIRVDGEHIYVSNSFSGVSSFRMLPEKALGLANPLPEGDWWEGIFKRCTALALHSPSRTLFCGDPMEWSQRGVMPTGDGALLALDISEAGRPVLKAEPMFSKDYLLRDLVVHGDLLVIALFGRGLRVADIASDGTISNLRDPGIEGDMRAVASDGEQLVALALDRGLVQLKLEGGELVELGALAMDGPKLDVILREGKAVASLGSAGAQIASLSESGPVIERVLAVPAVVTSSDLKGDALALSTLSGLYLYDLREEKARLAGFQHLEYAMLSARFVENDLIVSDWERLVRYSVNLDGEVTTVDSLSGLFITKDAPFEIRVRNHGGITLNLELLGSYASLGPGEEYVFEFDGGKILGQSEIRDVRIQVSGEVDGEPFNTQRQVTLGLRTILEESPESYPPIGSMIPSIALQGPEGEVFYLPEDGKPMRYVFFEFDCAVMWPELEDLAWAWRSGLLGDEKPVFIAEYPGSSGGIELWGYEDLRFGFSGEGVSQEVRDFNARLGPRLYESAFANDGVLPRSANHPTDHIVAADGSIRAVEVRYRGLWSFP